MSDDFSSCLHISIIEQKCVSISSIVFTILVDAFAFNTFPLFVVFVLIAYFLYLPEETTRRDDCFGSEGERKHLVLLRDETRRVIRSHKDDEGSA